MAPSAEHLALSAAADSPLEPSPSAPVVLEPQAQRLPSERMPKLWVALTLTLAQVVAVPGRRPDEEALGVGLADRLADAEPPAGD